MVNSFLQIVTPAPDTLLATIGALRVAAGLSASDNSRDAELNDLGKRVSAEIVEACRIAAGDQEDGGPVEPTLRREALKETFSGDCREVLVLSRRHGVSITSVIEDGRPVTINARGLRSEAGLLYRWIDGRQSAWLANEIVVEYEAGFETVPFSLAGVVVDLVRFRLSQPPRPVGCHRRRATGPGAGDHGRRSPDRSCQGLPVQEIRLRSVQSPVRPVHVD